MKRKIPWSSIIGFLLLLALGIGIPFWLEYRSLTNPAPTRASKHDKRQWIEAKKGYYCGNCGENITLPERGRALEKTDELSSPLILDSLTRPPAQTLNLSTRTPVSGLELHENP